MPASPMVYVIDDDAAVRDSLQLLLETYGIPVRGFASGEAFLSTSPPDGRNVLLFDLNMPAMTGFELLDELRRRGITGPAIIMTGGLTAGVPSGASLIEKPFSPAELIDRLKAAFSGNGS
jgi:two-component system response regulator FixJ